MSPAMRYALGGVCGVLGIGILLVCAYSCMNGAAGPSAPRVGATPASVAEGGAP